MRYFTPLALLAVLLFVPPRTSDAEKQRVPRPPHPPYSLIQNTSSPSHRYVMAWGVKGKNVNWNLLENSRSDRALTYLQNDVLSDEKNLQNYIVDKKTQRILGIVPPHYKAFHHHWDGPRKLLKFSAGGNYWRGAGSMNSHVYVSTYWLRDESRGVLLYDGKWGYDAIYAAEKSGDTFRVTEVGDVAESYLRRYLDRTRHRAYQAAHTADDRNPTIEAHKFRLTRDYLTMDMVAYIPKHSDDPASFFYKGTMRLALTHGKNELHARVVSLKERPRQPDED